MRDIFQTYPEFLCIDATYMVNDLRMPLSILLIENGNGQSEIVGMWLVVDESEEMMTEMIKLFKEQNVSWDKEQTVMSDKDFVEREVAGQHSSPESGFANKTIMFFRTKNKI